MCRLHCWLKAPFSLQDVYRLFACLCLLSHSNWLWGSWSVLWTNPGHNKNQTDRDTNGFKKSKKESGNNCTWLTHKQNRSQKCLCRPAWCLLSERLLGYWYFRYHSICVYLNIKWVPNCQLYTDWKSSLKYTACRWQWPHPVYGAAHIIISYLYWLLFNMISVICKHWSTYNSQT